MNAIASFTFTVPGCPVPWERVTPRGAGVAKDAADLLAKVIRGDYQWPNGVAWAVGETHRILTGGPPDGVYVRAKKDAESGKAAT